MSSQEFLKDLLFVTVGFVAVDGDPLHRRCVDRSPTRHFSHAVCTFNYMHITLHGSRRATQCVCVCASFHLHVILMSVSSCLSFSCFSPSFTSSLSHSTSLCPALHLQCQQRRGKFPLRLGITRSIAPWRYTLLSLEERAVRSIQRNAGRTAQAWVNVRRGLRVFAVFCWDSEGWTPRNEALMEAVVRQGEPPGIFG